MLIRLKKMYISTVFYRNKKKFYLIGVLLTIGFLRNSLSTQKNVKQIESRQQQEEHVEIVTDFYQYHLWPKQSKDQEKICKLPRLNLTGHDNIEPYKNCKSNADWGYLKNSHWYFNKTVVSSLKNIECTYRNISKLDDFKLVFSRFEKLVDSQLIVNDVIEVKCISHANRTKMELYSNLHVQILNKINQRLIPNRKEFVDGEQCEPLNILLLSYDSISRVSWFKRLPKTTEYLIKNMKTTVLYGHNIVGDGTPACMIPVLTGSTEAELPSTLKSDPNGQYVDQAYPFIWNDLHKNGYMSFHMEDWPQVSAFTYRLRGFSNKTAHHYMRSYQLALWQRVQQNYFKSKDDLCIGSVKRNKKSLDLIQQFMDMYKYKSNHISIMHYIENSHDGNERANYLDDDLKKFLQHNFESGNFDNTAVFLYSDHGSRFATERWTSQGDLEERQPFVSLFLPENYRKANPDKYKNLLKNSQQITSPFDIHMTIRELSCTRKTKKPTEARSMSLLGEIPLNRTCESIGLSIHYCVCELNWNVLDVRDKFSVQSARFIVDYLNKVLERAKDYCYSLKLMKINYIKMVEIKTEFYVKINFITKPNDALYQALIKYDEKSKKLLITSTDSISRLNAYGNQPKCLQYAPPSKNLTIDLRKFCLCKPKRRQIYKFKN